MNFLAKTAAEAMTAKLDVTVDDEPE